LDLDDHIKVIHSIILFGSSLILQAGGPQFNVELGRLDGMVSLASNVPGNLPEPTFNLNQLNALFRRKGLKQTDMIALSGN
jgi:peroxidase